MSRALVRAVAIALAFAASARARQASDLAAIGVVQAEPGRAVLDALLADVDGSGASDLLIAERTDAGRRIAAVLAVLTARGARTLTVAAAD